MENNKNLSERKEKILRVVVDEYIKNATPVSSGEIKRKHFDNLSSATIRAEMSTLEDMGYLIQPHTSAGRIPSKDAYRLYIDRFMVKLPLRQDEIALINQSFQKRFNSVEEIIKKTAKVISDITNYTSVIVLHNINKVKIKSIKLVDLDEHSALVIIITDNGIIRDNVITLKDEIGPQYIVDANALINKIFSDRTIEEVRQADELVDKELDDFRELYESIIAILLSYEEGNDSNVYIEGTSKIFDYPEYDLDATKNFLSIIDKKGQFSELMKQNQDIEFSVKIGKDEALENCAIVSARYKIRGKEIGHAGVIGPERMDYSKVISVLNYVGKTLEEIANGGCDGEEDE